MHYRTDAIPTPGGMAGNQGMRVNIPRWRAEGGGRAGLRSAIGAPAHAYNIGRFYVWISERRPL